MWKTRKLTRWVTVPVFIIEIFVLGMYVAMDLTNPTLLYTDVDWWRYLECIWLAGLCIYDSQLPKAKNNGNGLP